MELVFYLLSIIIGYAIGSLSPAYFLGKVLKNVDIREVGDKNAGTSNVYKVLGIIPAIITATYDLSKGLLAMLVASLIGVPEPIIYLSGLAAIVGHVFPFYLNFIGGQGVATATGLLFYCLYMFFKNQFLPYESLGIMAIVVISIYAITRKKGFLALIVMPSLLFMIFKNYPINYLTIFTAIIIIHIFAINIYEASRTKLFELKIETIEKISPWRTMLRPLSAIFPIMYFYLDKEIMLWILGILGGIFFIMDASRLISTKVNLKLFHNIKYIYKKREEKRFSSITLFFISVFFTILLFDKYIAITAIMYLIFGDVFAKFFGSEYGRTKIGDKTLEGSIAFFTVSLLVGYLLWPYVNLSPFILALGALVAAIAELIPIGINDNFIIALSSAAAMMLAKNNIF